ncbi:MAG: T9SS type A sorting domain-containing protein [Sphingobacteriales bacterium]|nr:T9SS type A sorting domain-containing protein [Sphingobacteriales bacterium]
MRRSLPFLPLCVLLFISLTTRAQSSTSTLDVVSWNLEWFGAASGGPANEDLQESNAKKIMRYLDADLYGVVEVVDTMRFRRLVDSLGNAEYGYFISPFCSNNTTGTGNSWLSGQKLGFIYRKSIFTNVRTRGLLRTSSAAYTSWASGRFPYMLSATATINSVSKDINFIVIHGKAGSTASDYDRRRAGAQELKDTLDAQFASTINIIIGDYNDALNGTISTGSGPESSYQPIILDSTDADHYKSITLPLGVAGQSSMINFPNVVDNHVISNEATPFYVLSSAKIRNDITAVVPDYATAHTTSDHYPVFSNYSLEGLITGVPVLNPAAFGIQVSPNPFGTTLRIRATKSLTNTTIRLLNMQGGVIYQQPIGLISAGMIYTPKLPALQRGIYFLQVETRQQRTVIKLTHL